MKPKPHCPSRPHCPALGLLIPAFIDDYQSDIWNGARQAAAEHALNLMCFTGGSLGYSPDDSSQWQRNALYDLISPERIDGLILSPSINPVSNVVLQTLCERYAPLPVVSIGRVLKGIPHVMVDYVQSTRIRLNHLLEDHGYRRLAFIRRPEGSGVGEIQFRTYVEALRDHGIPFDPDLVVTSAFSSRDSAMVMETLFEQRQLQIDAIVPINDGMALDIMELLLARGIRVPEDVAVMGFDNIAHSEYAVPPLSTAQQPVYELGRRAVEVLAGRLRGNHVPPETLVPSELIIRQSCGCLDPDVVRAGTGFVSGASKALHAAAVLRREAVVAQMRQAVGKNWGQVPGWAERLFDAFAGETTPASAYKCSGNTLSVLRGILYQVEGVGGNMEDGHNALSVLRGHFLPALAHDASRSRCMDDVCQQGRVLIGKMGQQVQMRQQAAIDEWADVLRDIGQRLIKTFDVAALMDVLAEYLPRLGIAACYLALYDDPLVPARAARLLLAYDEEGRIALDARHQQFPSALLVPPAILPLERASHGRPAARVVEPLYFGEEQLGYVVFQAAAREGKLFEILQGQISSALQGALLVQRVQEHAAEIDRKQYILDTFMATVPDRIYFKDREGRLIQVNQAHARRMGAAEPAAVLGKSDFDLYPDEEARVKYAQECEIMRTGQPLLSIEEQSSLPDGRIDWTLTTKMPLRNEHGEIIGTFGISRDITELKRIQHELMQYRNQLEELVKERTTDLSRANTQLHQEITERLHAEQALRVSEQQYRLLAENVKDGIVILQEARIVFANSVFSTMSGYSPDQLQMIGPERLFSDPAARHVRNWFAHSDQAPEESHWQTEMLTSTGQALWADIEATPLIWNSHPALLLTIRNITEQKRREQRLEEERVRLQHENLTLKSTIKERYRFGELIGKSLPMQRVYELIMNAAASDMNVVIYGESGTGKELIARTIHQVSRRKPQAFVPINCASIPETLFEREFFGHRKGAFTGAERDTPGFFDQAHEGTLFLDEVTELTPGTQAKLLRVLQDGEYMPLGRATPKQADVLIVAATNKDCREEIARGRLRKDFFYRIGIIEINVPPLRERKDDLPLLIDHILEEYSRKHADLPQPAGESGLPDQSLLPNDLLHALYAYDWPGNVRELQNILHRYLATRDVAAILALLGEPRAPRALNRDGAPFKLPDAVSAFEKQQILDMLARNQYHVTKTAEMLGIPRITLHRKIKKYQIQTKP